MPRLVELRDIVTSYAAAFDAGTLSVADCEAALREVAAIDSALNVVKAALSARLAASSAWRDAGARNAIEHIARTAGTTTGAASTLVESGRALEAAPAVRDAAVTGQISTAQTALIATTVAAARQSGALDPSAQLVAKAGRLSLGELRTECTRVKAAADADPAATRRRIHDERSYRRWDDGYGKGFVQISGPLSDIVLMESAIAPARERLFQQAHRDGRTERNDALDYDALLATVRASQLPDTTSSQRSGADGERDARRVRGKWWNAKVIIRVDATALDRGRVADGEICEVTGAGPIAVEDARDAVLGDAFVAAVVTQGEQVSGVAHLGRRPTALQVTALEWISPTCSAEGCNRRARQIDHEVPWAVTRHTLLEELDRFCDADHDRKTYDDWALIPGVGKRAFVPPDDPRHPGRAVAQHAG